MTNHFQGKITDDTTLVHQTDYGSFPNLESHHGPPFQDFVRLGPGLSVIPLAPLRRLDI